MTNIRITKLILENFRNYSSKKLDLNSQLILLVGENGVGKTNILEALTIIGKGQNLRSADYEDMIGLNYENNLRSENFSIFTELEGHDLIEKIGISYDKNSKKKTTQINSEILNNKQLNDFKNSFVNFIWLTPQLELLLISGKSERRDYLDKIVCDIDDSHSGRVGSYQKALKERLLILQKYNNQKAGETWLKIVEDKIVELGVAIAFARLDAIEFFNKAINSFESNFPKTKLKISGEIEEMAPNSPALALEEFYKEKLRENRTADAANFKTAFGVHRSDFSAIFLDKNAPSSYSSTGEQKSIMIGITLARAKISAAYKNQPTILIFDEIMSHLDDKKKHNLLTEILDARLQCFFSATSKDLLPKDFTSQDLIQIIQL